MGGFDVCCPDRMGQRSFRRNLSISSSTANNEEGAAAASMHDAKVDLHTPDEEFVLDDLLVQQEVCDSGISSVSLSAGPSILQQPCSVVDQLCATQQLPLLLFGTSAGVFQLDLLSQQVQLLGLPHNAVCHLSYSNGLVLASCPKPDDPGLSAQETAAAVAAAGLYCLTLDQGATSSGPAQCGVQVSKLWDGNAK